MRGVESDWAFHWLRSAHLLTKVITGTQRSEFQTAAI